MVSSGDDKLFYLSGALSLLLFLLSILLFGAVLFPLDSAKSFAQTKQDFVSVSLHVMDLPKPSTDKGKTPAPQQASAASETPLVTTPDTPQDVSSLFDDVWTKDISKKKTQKKQPEDTAKRIASIEKRLKASKPTTQSTAAADKIAALKLVKTSVAIESGSTSAASEVNEYYAKIQAIIFNHFYPPANSEGNSAKVFLRIENDGTLSDARILVASGQRVYDREIEALLRRLEAVDFPTPPDTQAIELKIILTAKE